ncbi:MAG: YcxB family protein [Paracoccus sp. (in: a-proteobacteria)]
MGDNMGRMPLVFRAGAEDRDFRRSFALDLDDHLHIGFRSPQLLPTRPIVISASALGLFLGLLIFYECFARGEVLRFILSVAATVAAFMLAGFLLLRPARWLLRDYLRRRLAALGAFGRELTSTVNRNGVHFTLDGQSTSLRWDALTALEEDDLFFYFWASHEVAHPWPKRLFRDDSECREFRDFVEIWSERGFTSPPVLARLGDAGRRRLVLGSAMI